jgi:hypothetical protein
LAKEKRVKTPASIFAGFLLLFTAGCQRASDNPSYFEQKNLLEKQIAELSLSLKNAEAQNKTLKNQIGVLSGLQSKGLLGDIYQLQNVEIGNYTSIGKQENTGKETLFVYIKPVDSQGDAIKAPGSADIRLWDLNKPPAQALVAEWHVEADEMMKLWFSTLWETNYRLTFDLTGKIDAFSTPLTIRITFIDYITGKVFNADKLLVP